MIRPLPCSTCPILRQDRLRLAFLFWSIAIATAGGIFIGAYIASFLRAIHLNGLG